jgi:hypothetical protein
VDQFPSAPSPTRIRRQTPNGASYFPQRDFWPVSQTSRQEPCAPNRQNYFRVRRDPGTIQRGITKRLRRKSLLRIADHPAKSCQLHFRTTPRHLRERMFSEADGCFVRGQNLGIAFIGEDQCGAGGQRSADRLGAGRVGDPPRQRAFNPNDHDEPSQARQKLAPYLPARNIGKHLKSADVPLSCLALDPVDHRTSLILPTGTRIGSCDLGQDHRIFSGFHGAIWRSKCLFGLAKFLIGERQGVVDAQWAASGNSGSEGGHSREYNRRSDQCHRVLRGNIVEHALPPSTPLLHVSEFAAYSAACRRHTLRGPVQACRLTQEMAAIPPETPNCPSPTSADLRA